MAEFTLRVSDEIRSALLQHMDFMTQSMGCECRLTIYWQNEVYNYNDAGEFVEVLRAGWHVQALPVQSGLEAIVVEGLTLWAASDDLEEIAGREIVRVNQAVMLS